MLILRNRKDHPDTNGVRFATNQKHHMGLKNDLPALCSVSTYANGLNETQWQMLKVDCDDF